MKSKQYLTKDQNSCVVLVIGICCVFGLLLLISGSEEFYKLNTLIIRHCQVKSIDLKYIQNSFFPRWNITVTYQNETKDDVLIERFGTKLDKWAWIKVRIYKINETYPCYRSTNKTSIIQWGWQWTKPTKFKICTFLFSGIILFVIATGLIRFKRRYQLTIQNIQHQEDQQLNILLRSKEQQQKIPSSQYSSPTNEK